MIDSNHVSQRLPGVGRQNTTNLFIYIDYSASQTLLHTHAQMFVTDR